MCDVQYTSFRTIETKGTVVGKDNTDTDIIFDDIAISREVQVTFILQNRVGCRVGCCYSDSWMFKIVLLLKSYLVLFNIQCETFVVISVVNYSRM